jgi:hypothetical protein
MEASPPTHPVPGSTHPANGFDVAAEFSALKSRLLAVEESSMLTEMENRELRARVAILEKEKARERDSDFEKWAKGQLENLGARVPALEGRHGMAVKRVCTVEKRIDGIHGVVKGVEARVRAGSSGGAAPPSIPPPPPGLGMGPVDLPAVLRDIAAIHVLWAWILNGNVEEDEDEDEDEEGSVGSADMDLDTDEE